MSFARMLAKAGLTGDNFGEIWSICRVSGSALRPSSRHPITPRHSARAGGICGSSCPGSFRSSSEAVPARQANQRRRRFRMALPDFSMRQLLESGAHFGHRTQRWNPKMAPYIYGARNDIHILDLTQTVPLLHRALVALRETAAGGGRILFDGTKRQASAPVAAAAKRCAQYYVTHRWLGGTLTNWQTISNSIKRMRGIDETLTSAQTSGLKKMELLGLLRERDKLERSLGGIKEMGGLPNMLFVIDTNKESIAIAEARKLGIPVTAILDSNSDPDGIAHPIPGNDDAARAIALYCDLAARAVIDGLGQSQTAAGVDLGEAEVVTEAGAAPLEAEPA